MDWQEDMIILYLYVCKEFQKTLFAFCQRMSNYADLSFTDEEVITIYMLGIIDKKRTLKEIYIHAKRYWNDWFPKLPTYTAFVQRINKVCDVFIPMINKLQSDMPEDAFRENGYRLIDSMPIVLAARGRRFTAKVAPEIADKNGYCATKKMYYYGVKLHIMGCASSGTLPIPEFIGLTGAGMNDDKAYKQILPELYQNTVFADKAYYGDKNINETVELLTPVKKSKGQDYLETADQWFSTAVSRVRQPIEALFSWIEAKTSIQMASKVRSYHGLMVHVFGRIASAMFIMMRKFSS